jgi:hypothetical protein
MSLESKPKVPLLNVRLVIAAADLLGIIFSAWSLTQSSEDYPLWLTELIFVCLSVIFSRSVTLRTSLSCLKILVCFSLVFVSKQEAPQVSSLNLSVCPQRSDSPPSPHRRSACPQQPPSSSFATPNAVLKRRSASALSNDQRPATSSLPP